jgi:hypothetical protein
VFIVWSSGYTTEPSARFRFPNHNVLANPRAGALKLRVVHRIPERASPLAHANVVIRDGRIARDLMRSGN